MPEICGVPGVRISVLLSTPGKGQPLMVEYAKTTVEYLFKVVKAQLQASVADPIPKRAKDPLGLQGVSKSKYGGTSLRSRRGGKNRYIKYTGEDEFAEAVKKARLYIDGVATEGTEATSPIDDDDCQSGAENPEEDVDSPEAEDCIDAEIQGEVA